jgi:hypothetical protein
VVPRSSIFNSDVSVVATVATPLVALVVILIAGAALRSAAIDGGGDVALASYQYLAREAYRYNALNRTGGDEILLLGSSLVRHALIERRLADALGRPGLRVMNLGLDGAGPWEMLRLVERIDPPRATGNRIAFVEINRFAEDSSAPISAFGRERLRKAGRESRPRWSWLFDAAPPKQPLVAWIDEIRYKVISRHWPRLVPVPAELGRPLWTAGEVERRRAVSAMGPVGEAMSQRVHRLSEEQVWALELLVGELKRRGYMVVIFQAPVHTRYLRTLLAQPGGEAGEAEFAALRNPARLGADAALILTGPEDLGADDHVFADYAHLTEEGASLQTDAIARFLLQGGTWRTQPGGPP